MKDQDPFSEDGSPPTEPQDTPSPAHLPSRPRRLTRRPHMRLPLVALLLLLVVAAGYGVFLAVSPRPRQASSAFQQAHCPFTPGQGLVEGKDVRCGFVVVPEDRSQPKSPTIRLAVAIFKTSSPHPAPDPVLVLGGAGEALLEKAGPTYTAGNLPSNRDLILVDQRGAGYSQPSLKYGYPAGLNLNAFTTLESAADVHDLIGALGYRQVNLDGVSYGTRLALTVMRLFPADLRSVVLDSVLPPQVNGFTSRPPAAARAFAVLFHGCAADRHCNATYPHLQAVFYQLITDLNTTPLTFQVTPKSGTSLTIHFRGNDLVVWLWLALHETPVLPQIPAVIYQLRRHDTTRLASLYDTYYDTSASQGLSYATECGEDMAYTTQHALQTSVQGLAPAIQPALLAMNLMDFFVCQSLRIKAVPAIQKSPVRSSLPTLILQGEYDPVTPPANGLLAAQTLSRSSFFLFPGVGHGVLSPTSTCPDAIEQAFLNNPTVKPAATCIRSMPEPAFT